MPSQEAIEATEALRQLESTWISLLLWLAEQTGESAEAIVARAGEPGEKARTNFERERARQSLATFTPFHFLDFPAYIDVAASDGNRQLLEGLGQPPRGWTAQIRQQNERAVQLRNHLAHADRFDRLPVSERREAVQLFRAQRNQILTWWPTHVPREVAPQRDMSPFRTALQPIDRDERSGAALVRELGLMPVPSPIELIGSGTMPGLTTALDGYASRLYRVGGATPRGGAVGVYFAYLDPWPIRSSERERFRKRIAKAIVEQTQDRRWLIVLLDEQSRANEIEFVLPSRRGGSQIATVRAAVNPLEPTRYHLDLLNGLKIQGLTTLPEITKRWNETFSVEAVTNRFYREFHDLRDRIIDALVRANPDNPALQGLDPDHDHELNAFATRQLSRLLFIWFLQQKRWMGADPGAGNPRYLLEQFWKKPAGEDTYFSDVLIPIFFEGLGLPIDHPAHLNLEQRLGELPYLNGGLFRVDADPFERELFGVGADGQRTRRVLLPDDLFDPAKDDLAPARRGGQRARTVLGLLSSYRFTTQESTPDDQSVDPDPELLGKVFENLYQENERHETGAYYTPREIVRYMCREALDGYLVDKVGIERSVIEWLRKEATDWTESDQRLSAAEVQSLERALNEVAVLDPAVGSGAFLVGMLQEIVLLKRGIEQSERDREVPRSSERVAGWKRQAITRNLFGVDLNPMAVEICRLRLWLSLIIELEAVTRHDIPALPNLELQVLAGDSLIDRMGEDRFVESLPLDYVQFDFEMAQRQRELNDLHELFERADQRVDLPRVREITARIREKQREIARVQVEAVLRRVERERATRTPSPRGGRALAALDARIEGLRSQLASLERDEGVQKPLLWPLAFPHVFEAGRGGFDIVVANPPYVRQESLSAIDQQSYQQAFPEVYAGTADLLVYFFARAAQLLREGGHLAFITSNKYMRANYGAGVRGFLATRLALDTVIDFGDLPVFDVAAYPAVVTGRKSEAISPEQTVKVADLVWPIRTTLKDEGLSVNVTNVRMAVEQLPEFVEQHGLVDYPQIMLRREGWILENPTLVQLFERLMNEGTSLGEYVNGRMYYGIKTGHNDAFVIDQATRDRLIAEDSRSADLIKPWLRGRDIKRWKAEWAGLHIIAIQHSGDADARHPWQSATSESEASAVFQEAYPSIFRHMAHFEEQLRRRADQGKFWWELRSCAYYSELIRPKIVWSDIAPKPRFFWDEEGYLTDTTIFQCTDVDNAVLGILNSNVAEFLLRFICPSVRGGYLRLKLQYLELFPIPAIDSVQRDAIMQSVEQILNGATERELNEHVFDVFKMTQSERGMLRSWLSQRHGAIELPEENEDGDDGE